MRRLKQRLAHWVAQLSGQLEGRLQRWMERANRGHYLPALAALLSFGGTISAGYPVTLIVLLAVMLAPRRWLLLSIACASGSALAGCTIIGLSHALGYDTIHAWFPGMTSMDAWQQADLWLNDWGIWAIFIVGASPLPQMPLLIFFGIVDDRLFEAALALWGGKLLKYGVMAWVAQHFPQRFAFFQRLHGARSTPATPTDAAANASELPGSP